jgi:hypothetical protein
MRLPATILAIAIAIGVAATSPASALNVNWIDWTSSEVLGGVFTAYGSIV